MELHEPFDHITEFREEERCSVIKSKTLIYYKNNYMCLLITFASQLQSCCFLCFLPCLRETKLTIFWSPQPFGDEMQDDSIHSSDSLWL